MDVQILAWLALVASGISNALTVWNFFQSPSRKNETAIQKVAETLNALIDKMDARLGQVERSVNALDVELRQLPNRDMTHRLEISLERMAGEMSTVNAKLAAVENLSRRLQEFMLERGSK